MKRNRFTQGLMAAMTLMATACTEQENVSTPSVEPTALRATIVDDKAATRSIVIDNPGIRLESFWKEGDRIGVFSASAQNISFSVASGTISADGKTADFKSTTTIPSGELTAYYPYSTSATFTTDDLKLQFPSTQHYTEVGGVAQPDPEACVIVGKGSKDGGISFVNVMAVLKVGQVFDTKTTVRSVEFRDLNGGAVSGAYTVSFSGSNPEAKFTGNGQVLTLDLGTEGVTAEENSLFTVFLVVPARLYPKGFEITFVDSEGNKTVKTAGSKDGKTLQRSVVYPVGDVTTYEDVPGMICELKPTAQIMTPEKLDMVTVTNYDNSVVRTDDGETAVDRNGNTIRLPHLTMTVHRDMNPRVGGWLIFNQPSNDMPQGGIYRVETCKPMADGEHYEVYAVPEANFAAPFEVLTIGDPLYDDDGNLNPEGGVDIDISSYVKEVRDGEGNTVSTRSPTGYEMNAAEGMRTRAVGHSSFTTPALTLSIDDGNHCTCDVSSKMTVNMRLAIGIIHGELQYIYQTVNPKLEMKTTFGLYGKYEIEKRQHLWTFYTAGIPIGPVVVLPEVAFNAFGGVGGEAKFTASTTFNYDLGTYGLAYNKGQGLTFRRVYTEPSKDDSFNPTLDAGFSGNLYAFGGIGMRAGISVYAMCSLGANTDAKLTFGVANQTSHENAMYLATKLHLTPEIDIAPYTAVLGGKMSHVWKGLTAKVEFDPIWERYLSPEISDVSSAAIMNESPYPMALPMCDGDTLARTIPTGCNKVFYHAKFQYPTFKTYKLALDIYEGTPEMRHIGQDKDKGADFWGYTIEQYAASGHPHMYKGGVIWIYHNGNRIHRSIVGEYTPDMKEKVFDGSIPYNFESGRGYAVALTLIRDDNTEAQLEDVDGMTFSDSNDPLISRQRYVWFYYPNDAQGRPYEKYKVAHGAGYGEEDD